MEQIDYRTLKELYYSGISMKDISEKMGIKNASRWIRHYRFKRRKKDLQKQGELHNVAKLKQKDVDQIRVLISKGVTNKHIAEFYNVDPSTIGSIRRGKSWKNKSKHAIQNNRGTA